MKVKDIWQQKAGVIIPEFTARLIKIYPPKEPTAGQAKVGIHKQTLIGQGHDGTEIRIVLLKEHMHIPTSEAGALYTFKSTNDDKNRLGGIITCEWQPKDKPDMEFYVEVNGQANFFAVQEDTPAVAANKPAGAPQRMPAPKSSTEEFTPSIADHVDFYCQIVDAMEKRLAGSAMFESLLKDPAPMFASCTSIFIQCAQNGTFRRGWKPVIMSGEGQYATPEQQAEMIQPQEEHLDEDIDARFVHLALNGDMDTCAEMFSKIDPERAYDLLCERLTANGQHPMDVLNAAFDHLKQKIGKGATGRQVCEGICFDPGYFLEVVAKAQIAWTARNAPAPVAPAEVLPPEAVFDDSLLTPVS